MPAALNLTLFAFYFVSLMINSVHNALSIRSTAAVSQKVTFDESISIWPLFLSKFGLLYRVCFDVVKYEEWMDWFQRGESCFLMGFI
jgi:hypothetical protein